MFGHIIKVQYIVEDIAGYLHFISYPQNTPSLGRGMGCEE